MVRRNGHFSVGPLPLSKGLALAFPRFGATLRIGGGNGRRRLSCGSGRFRLKQGDPLGALTIGISLVTVARTNGSESGDWPYELVSISM